MVGAGQLARMTHQAAIDLGVDLVVLATSEHEPAVRSGATTLLGRPDDRAALHQLAARCDVVTFDHEQVPADLVAELAASGHRVGPSGEALRLAQDKLLARVLLAEAGLPVPDATGLGDDVEREVAAFAEATGWPVVLKARSGGYDGRGVEVVGAPDQLPAALARLGAVPQGAGSPPPVTLARPLLVEAHVPIALELAILGVRTVRGSWVAYPPIATVQVDGICHELVMPAPIPDDVAERAGRLARTLADGIGAVGVIAVELFLTTDGALVVNELALRPHNSGHATIEAAATSQFQNHLRAVLDWPLGSTELRAPAAAMVNVLGDPGGADPRHHLDAALAVGGASVHLYDKSPAPGRKLGHVTALGARADEALAVARRAARALQGDHR